MNWIVYFYRIGGAKCVLAKIMNKLLGLSWADDLMSEKLKGMDVSQCEDSLKLWYKYRTGEKLNLNDPKSFNEKIQWMKKYDLSPLKTKLADKYLVREWVKEKIGEEYLIPLMGVWDKFDDIDFDLLPDRFVLKCNHGSSWNLIVSEKAKLDKYEAKKKFDKWMNRNFAFTGFEMQYKDIPRKIIAEEYMGDNLLDYKIHVFNGEPRIIKVIGDRNIRSHFAHEAVFDTEWNRSNLMYKRYDPFEELPKKPDNLDDMLRIASVLGEVYVLT